MARFEQLVLLDADMVVLKNMDELLLTPLDTSLVS
jgi:alpha-N-acetylglucosamine transferase